MLFLNTNTNIHSSYSNPSSIRIVAHGPSSKSIVGYSGPYSKSTSKLHISVAQLWLLAYSRNIEGNTYCFSIVQNSGDFF